MPTEPAAAPPAQLSAEQAIAAIRADYESRYGTPRSEPIEAGRVRDYLLAMNEPADASPGQPVPALFLLTLARTRRPQPSQGGAVNAGDEFEFHAPACVGDTITVSRRIAGIDQKEGKMGRMFLIRAEANYNNQRGELVAIARQNTLRWGW